MKKKAANMLSLCLAIVVMAASCPVGQALAQGYEKPYVLSLFDHSGLDLSPYRNKALFLYFFVEGNPRCMEEMQHIKQIYQTYDEDELQIVLIHVWDGEDEDGQSAERIGEAYDVEELVFYEDQTKQVAGLVGLPSYPTSIFIDKEGYLQDALARFLEYDLIAEVIESMEVAKKSDAREEVSEDVAEPTDAVPQGIQIMPPQQSQGGTPTASPNPGTASPAPTGRAPLGSHGVVGE